MDTFKDKQRLEELNQGPGTAPWKVWEHGVSAISNHTAVLAAGV
jgi:hypothetical protein